MKKMRIIIIAIAATSALGAAWMATSLSGNSNSVTAQVAPQIVNTVEMEEILVAKESLPVGARLNEETLEWMEWPQNAITEAYITKNAQPDAIADMSGTIVRLPIFVGEPVRSEKIVSSSSRIMSSLLPAGKRAVAAEISVATGAGGFILPNDRVDVIMVRTDDETGELLTDNILENIRILAIDQRIEEDAEGNRTAVGSTATLELTPEQSHIIAAGQEMAQRITLALRSVADAYEDDNKGADYLVNPGSGSDKIQVIRSGQISQVGAGND